MPLTGNRSGRPVAGERTQGSSGVRGKVRDSASPGLIGWPASSRRVVEGVQPSAGREPALGERAGARRLAVEESDADGEDRVEAPLAEVDSFSEPTRNSAARLQRARRCGARPQRPSSASGRSRSGGRRRAARRRTSPRRRARSRSRARGRPGRSPRPSTIALNRSLISPSRSSSRCSPASDPMGTRRCAPSEPTIGPLSRAGSPGCSARRSCRSAEQRGSAGARRARRRRGCRSAGCPTSWSTTSRSAARRG